MDPVVPFELMNVTVNVYAYELLTALITEPQPGLDVVTVAILSFLSGLLLFLQL